MNPRIKFLLLTSITYVGWLLLYYLYIVPFTSFERLVSRFLVYTSTLIMKIWGQEGAVYEDSFFVFLTDKNNIEGIVQVGGPCNGLKIIPLYLVFILFFPNRSLTQRLKWVLIGTVSIHVVNAIRIVALLNIQEYNPDYLRFNHDYTFTYAVYAFILFLWWRFTKLPSVKQ